MDTDGSDGKILIGLLVGVDDGRNGDYQPTALALGAGCCLCHFLCGVRSVQADQSYDYDMLRVEWCRVS